MDRAAFSDGLRDVAPAVPPNVPFGMLFGATAVAVGMDPLQATSLSLLTFAATAQIVAVDLLRGGSPLPVVLATVVVINLRYVVYSASLAGMVRDASPRWRALMSYALFDINYALAEARFAGDDRDDGHRGWYFLGTSVPVIVSFVGSTLAGALAGEVVGADLHLEFTIPLVFVAVLMRQVDDVPAVVTAVVAAAIAIVAGGLPFNLGLIVAAVCGTLVGAVAEVRRSRRSRQ